MSFIDKIRACNAWNPADFIPFILDGQRLGWIRRAACAHLTPWPDHFLIAPSRIVWIAAPKDFSARTAILDAVCLQLAAQGIIDPLTHEPYPLTATTRERACCVIDRACAPFFGARAFGQHLNGYVRMPQGIELWIGQRSANRRHYPLHLDNLVAGGLPYGLSLVDNLRKECAEEADIPPEFAERAIPVGAVTYCRDSETGLKPDVMYCYDLELPEDFRPVCRDGEVESFQRLTLAEVAELVRDTDRFKLNCNLTIIDFLIRHGFITPDEPDYLELIAGLRSPLP